MSLASKIKAALAKPAANLIYTTRGMMDESLLVKTEGVVNDYNEYTTWQEWRLGDEIVKREAQIHLKKGLAFATEAGKVGG